MKAPRMVFPRFVRPRPLMLLCCLCVWAPLLRPATFPEPVFELVAPGVAAATVQSQQPPMVFHVVKADLRKGNLKLGAIKAQGKETLAQIAQRLLDAKRPLLAAINGDYFELGSETGRPWGAHIQENLVYFSPTKKSVFLVDLQGRPLIDVPTLKLGIRLDASGPYQKIVAVNRPRASGDGGFYLYTPMWGANVEAPGGGIGVTIDGGPLLLRETVKGSVRDLLLGGAGIALPESGYVLTYGDRGAKAVARLKTGGPVAIRGELAPAAVEAIGGGPRLVRGGKVAVEFKEEAFEGSHAQYLSGRHPRAAVGYTKARDLVILVVVEGRSGESTGLSMGGLAQLMAELGASDAMAFDGGGSATLYVTGKLLATGGGAAGAAVEERRLGNALGIFYEKQKKP
jgi:hypothetical protein